MDIIINMNMNMDMNMDISKNNRKIAIYNGLRVHYEMFGYLLYYCLEKNINVVIYCYLNDSNGYIDFFKNLFQYSTFEFRCITLFDSEKHQYYNFILATDDDLSFNSENEDINNRTIRIDHDLLIRRIEIKKCIATRPFFNGLVRPWAIPCYPIINLNNRLDIFSEKKSECHVLLLGNDHFYYTSIINRLYSDRPIILHAISRDMKESRFSNLSENITLKIYKNIHTIDLFKIAIKCDFILTDTNVSYHYENQKMSGAIPLSFSILVPLIISKQTNSHYQFTNVIEFDKYSDENIVLDNKINGDFFIRLENERMKLISMFFKIMDYYLST